VHLLRATLPPQAQLACTSVRARPLVPMTLNTYCHVDWFALVTVIVAMGKHCRPWSKLLQMVQSGIMASTCARFQAARERTHVQQIAVAKNKIWLHHWIRNALISLETHPQNIWNKTPSPLQLQYGYLCSAQKSVQIARIFVLSTNIRTLGPHLDQDCFHHSF